MAKLDTYKVSSTIQTNYGTHDLVISIFFEDGDITNQVINNTHTIILTAIENFMLEANNSSSSSTGRAK